MRIPSPSLESLGVLCKAKSSPLSWATRCEVLPEGQGVRVCQAGLGGPPSPFPQGLPGLLSGPKNRTKVSGEKGEAESTKPEADPSPPPMFQGPGPTGADGMPEPMVWPSDGLEPPFASSQKGHL